MAFDYMTRKKEALPILNLFPSVHCVGRLASLRVHYMAIGGTWYRLKMSAYPEWLYDRLIIAHIKKRPGIKPGGVR